MNNLEHILLLMAARIESGDEAPNAIVEMLKIVASAHHYADSDDDLGDLNQQMIREFGHLLIKKD